MKLSELLLKYEHGLKYKKLRGLPWWFNKLDEYYGGRVGARRAAADTTGWFVG